MPKNFPDLSSLLPEGMNRAARRNAPRQFKDEMKRIENVRSAIRNSGVGQPVDRVLRQLLDSCNDDRLSGAEIPFPNIWEEFSGFTETEPSALFDFFRLRPETDHAFSAADFFAFATEEELSEQTIPRLRALKEGTIHSYSALGDLTEMAFEQPGGARIVLSGITMVRHGSHLYWMTTGGPVMDLAAATEERRARLAGDEERVRAANPMASEDQIQGILNPHAVPLPGTDDVWLTHAMGLFNLDTAAHEVRILARDWGVSLAVFSDQFEHRFANAYDRDETIRRMVDKAVSEIEEARLFFEIAETAFTLPAYFSAKVGFVTETEIETGLAPGRRPREARYAMRAPADLRILIRRVATLDFGRGGVRPPNAYTPPRFRVEVDGFWRRLQPGSTGKDAKGAPIADKTWVRGHARWKDRPPHVGVVLVKTPIGESLRRAQEIVDKRGGEVSLKTAD